MFRNKKPGSFTNQIFYCDMFVFLIPNQYPEQGPCILQYQTRGHRADVRSPQRHLVLGILSQ